VLYYQIFLMTNINLFLPFTIYHKLVPKRSMVLSCSTHLQEHVQYLRFSQWWRFRL